MPFSAGAWFPGPHSENETWLRAEVQAVLGRWFDWRKSLFDQDPPALPPSARRSAQVLAAREVLGDELEALCERLTGEIPTHTPRYLGHMKAEVSLPALVGWLAAMLLNPNITSREAGRVGSAVEDEAITMLAAMLGLDPARAQGHFTSGGTIANFEGLWRARYRLDHWLALALYLNETHGTPLDIFAAAHMGWPRFRQLWNAHDLADETLRRYSAAAHNPADIYRRLSAASGRDYLGPVILVPASSHYSWRKAANIFGLGEEAFWKVGLDASGRLDLEDFAVKAECAAAAGRPILMAVSIAGTTETGSIDPVDRLADLLDRWYEDRGWRIWHHVDAAYGGFLASMLGGESEAALTAEAAAALKAVGRADSVTIDPHKLGYVPYACGAFLTRDAEHYAVSGFDAPYLDRPLLGPAKWSSTLEGSRAASGAAATWLTGRTIGFGPERFGALLAETVRTAHDFAAQLAAAVPDVRILQPIDSNIVCFQLAAPGEALTVSNARSERLYRAIHASPDFSVSTTTLGHDAQISAHLAGHDGVKDADGMTLVRCVFMNPYWSVPEYRSALFPGVIALVAAAAAEG